MAAEKRRGCGYRKIGGNYLVADGTGFPCGRFPLSLIPCPLCEHRPAFTRGLQRITPRNILHASPVCASGDPARCASCPLGKVLEQETAGLLWVGDRFYTPESFLLEASEQGISKRIPTAIPRWLKLGETWIFLAHDKGSSEACGSCQGKGTISSTITEITIEQLEGLGPMQRHSVRVCETCEGEGKLYSPAVFSAFRPSRIERIIPDTMPAEERAKLIEQGLTLVEVPADDPDHQPAKKSREEED